MRKTTRLSTAAIGLALAVASLGCSNSTTSTGSGPQPSDPATVGVFGSISKVQLQHPVRLAVAGDMVYVSDAKANAVVGYQGDTPKLALTGLATPLGVAVAGDLLYVGNVGRQDVEVYSLSQQKFLRTLGGVGAFVQPNSIAVAPDGMVYVADSKQDVVKIFAPDGSAQGQLGGRGTGEGQFRFPSSVAVDEKQVVVADRLNHRVQVFTRAGAFVRAFGGQVGAAFRHSDFNGKFTALSSVALQGGDILALDALHANVQKFSADGAYQGTFGYAGECASCTVMPLDIAVDAQGRVLATDPKQRRFVALSTELR